MSSHRASYHEGLLHWIWENRHFEFRQLQTAGGYSVCIHDPGRHNISDGPDFTGAQVTIGDLRWYGDVEIHWKLHDWNAHRHHNNANFNNVVLHVVYEETTRQSLREDGTPIPTLCLSPYIAEPLQSFLDRYRRQPELPCSGQLSFISEEAFAKQLEKAHREYFEQKVNDLMEFYDPGLPPSRAWTKMLAIALCDGLGISHNRASMQQLAAALVERLPEISVPEEFRSQALKLAGFDKRYPTPLDISWNHKGCRPGNHPRPRVLQAADALWHIYKQPFAQWMHGNPQTLWQALVGSIEVEPSLGRERASILFGTVFLPALYSLGNLFFSSRLKTKSWELWRNHRAPIPDSLLKMLDNTRLSSDIYARKLGTIHQLRAYCRPRNCQECKVFKNAISS